MGMLVAQKAEEINHMAQKSAKKNKMIGHLHRGKAREKSDNNNFGRILGMVTSSSSIKAWLVWDYDRECLIFNLIISKAYAFKMISKM